MGKLNYSWKMLDDREIKISDISEFINILLRSSKIPNYLEPTTKYNISIENFLKRWFKYDKNFRDYDMLIHFIYYIIEIFNRCNISEFYSKNSEKQDVRFKLDIYHAIITSLIFANKICMDEHYMNSYFAKIAGLSLINLNDLESQMLSAFDFDLHLNESRIKTSNDAIEILILISNNS